MGLTVVLTLAVHRFTVAETNVWQILGTIIGFQLLADMGFTQTFVRSLTYAMAGAADLVRTNIPDNAPNPNWKLVDDIHRTMRWVYRRQTMYLLFGLGIFGTLTLIRPISQLEEQWKAWIAWGLVLGATGATFITNADSAVLQGVGQIALLRRWEAIAAIGGTLSAILVLLAGGKLLSLIVANQIWVLIGAAQNRRLGREILSGRFRPKIGDRFDPQTLAHVWPRVWRSGIGILCSYGLVQGSGLVYAQFAVADSSASYQLALRFILIISQFSQAPFYSRLPQLCSLLAARKRRLFAFQAERGMKMSLLTFSVASTLVGVVGPFAFKTIEAKTQFPSPWLWLSFSAAFLLERHGGMHLQISTTTDKIVWHIANGITSVISLVLTAALAKPLGVIAFPASIAFACLVFFVPFSASRSHATLEVDRIGYELRVAAMPVVILAFYTAYEIYAHY